MASNDQVALPGERTNPKGKSVKNKILLSIPDQEYRSLRQELEFVSLRHHLVLHEPGEKLDFTYFLNEGLASLVVATQDGRAVEVGVVGNEGLLGTPAVVGLRTSPLRDVIQIPGDGFRVRVTALQSALPSLPEFRAMLNRYEVLQGMQVAQTAACNRLHNVEQRLARWLLMTQDRVNSGSLLITHDFLATMLGTDRSSVTLAAGVLQRKQLIKYTRGEVKVLNRKKLEGAACECYRVTQRLNGSLGLE